MKTTTSLCIALGLALGASSALADQRYHGGHRDGYYAPPPQYRQGGHRDGYYAPPPQYRHGGHGNRWVAPAAILAITGIAAGIAASTYYAPAPVYVAPPLPQPRPVYVVPARPVYVVPSPPVYAPPPGGYWGY